MANEPTIRWMRSATELALEVGPDRHLIPLAVADCLLGPAGADITGDPAADLITLEAELRATAADLVSAANSIEQNAVHAQAALRGYAAPRRSPAARQRRHASTTLVDAISEFTTTIAALNRVRGLIAALRSVVIDAAVPHGLLAEAARGWRRYPDRPRTVIVYRSEGEFLAADPRRLVANSRTLGEGVFGRGWRRDHEDDPRAADRTGPWTIGVLERIGEVYATVRSPQHPPQVWLLGADLPIDLARTVLENLLPRMPEPNSLILVAETVRAISGSQISSALDPGLPREHPAALALPSTTDDPIFRRGGVSGPSSSSQPARSPHSDVTSTSVTPAGSGNEVAGS